MVWFNQWWNRKEKENKNDATTPSDHSSVSPEMSETEKQIRDNFVRKLGQLSSSLDEVLQTKSQLQEQKESSAVAYDGWINRHWDLWVELELAKETSGVQLLNAFSSLEKFFSAHLEGLHLAPENVSSDTAKQLVEGRDGVCVWGWNRVRPDESYTNLQLGIQTVWRDRVLSDDEVQRFLRAVDMFAVQIQASITKVPSEHSWQERMTRLSDLVQDDRTQLNLTLSIPVQASLDGIKNAFEKAGGRRLKDVWVWFDPYDMPAVECTKVPSPLSDEGEPEVLLFRFSYCLPIASENIHAFEDMWGLVEMLALLLSGTVYRADGRQVDQAYAHQRVLDTTDMYHMLESVGLPAGGQQCRRLWSKFQGGVNPS